MDQSSRYANLNLKEEELITNGEHVLVYYKMKPSAAHYNDPTNLEDYVAAAAHFSAESSTGTNVSVSTTDDFTKSVDALVYEVDPANEEMKIAAVHALCELAKEDVPGEVLLACDVDSLSFGPEYIIPKPVDSRLLSRVSSAVARAAVDSGVATLPYPEHYPPGLATS